MTDDHGYAAYAAGCRCDVCRAAKREYIAARRAAGLEPIRVGVVRSRAGQRAVHVREHGTTTGYRRGCRCRPCMDAEIGAARARRERKQTAGT